MNYLARDNITCYYYSVINITERVIIVLSLQIILGGNMLGLVISLLIIALVVIINDIRIMNNNLTRFCLRSSANGLIYNQ